MYQHLIGNRLVQELVRSTLKATLLELLGMLKEVSAIAVSQDVLSLQWNYYTAVPSASGSYI